MNLPIAMYTAGHRITITANSEMGGGIEEVFAWCHTCDPEGSELVEVAEVGRGFTFNEALISVTTAALWHSQTNPVS